MIETLKMEQVGLNPGQAELLIRLRGEGKRVAGYGTPGKGNTLLNYCGIRTDFLEFTVDRNPSKQGCFLPGTHIPIHPVERMRERRPDYILILAWNLETEDRGPTGLRANGVRSSLSRLRRRGFSIEASYQLGIKSQ